MSILNPDERLPDNVEIHDRFKKDFALLDGRQKRIVAKAIIKIASAPGEYGEPLGNQHDRILVNFRSAYLDRKNLRLVWMVTPQDTLELMLVVAVGKRTRLRVYETVNSRRDELLRWEKALLEDKRRNRK